MVGKSLYWLSFVIVAPPITKSNTKNVTLAALYAIMLSVAINPLMLSIIVLNVVMLSVVML